MASYLDVCRFFPASTGTGNFVVSTAVSGYQLPTSANAVDGATYRYRAESSDLSQWEIGYGTYTVSSTTLARTTILFNSLGTTAAINFASLPQVAIVALAEDLIFINPPQGRLTLQSVTPVMTTTQSAKTTIFYTPYVGNQIPIYDGVSFRNVAFSELSVATTDTTKSPAAIGASKVNDWFIWDDSGTTRLGHGPDWTNDTTRSAGTALTMVKGILLNNAALTNGPAASRGTYVGTTRSNASSQLDWIIGGSASGGTAGFLGVWNTYNRVSTQAFVGDNGASYTYATGTTRQARASAGNQISFISGLAEDSIETFYSGYCSILNVVNAFINFGIGLDSTTTFASQAITMLNTTTTANLVCGLIHSTSIAPQLGFHVISANERGDGTNANTFNGNSLNNLSSTIRM